MPHTFRLHPRALATLPVLILCALAAGTGGCEPKKKQAPAVSLTPRYQTLPSRQVPAFLKDTILERCEVYNNRPFVVSGYGLVANLRGTGDCFAGTAVREYIRMMMIKRGFGNMQLGLEGIEPEDILQDPRFAIVRVDGAIPPGARKYQRFDVYVTALDGNNTSSLAHGNLYRVDLKINGANPQAPGYAVDVWANAEGEIFVNPVYAMTLKPTQPEVRASLRKGVVLNGGVVLKDRPLILRLRQPQLSMVRAIENRIDLAFQDTTVAAARDEALIALTVPRRYGEDWEHFIKVVQHLFLNPSPDFAVAKARQLAEEAVKPEAPLENISYCWEALGPLALPFVTPLMTHPKPEVAYASARAAAMLGETTAADVLLEIARTPTHPFQINAVQTLSKLPASPAVNRLLRELLDSDQVLVRLEAYRALAANGDPTVLSRPIGQKFMLDVAPSRARPIIYATRSGTPRIALLGAQPKLELPVLFTAMENRFSISSEQDRPLVTIFYRGPETRAPISILSPPDVEGLIVRLAGESDTGQPALNFTYCEIVSLLWAMSDQKLLSGQLAPDQKAPVAFVLQESSSVEQTIEQAPAIGQTAPEQQKPDSVDLSMPGGEWMIK